MVKIKNPCSLLNERMRQKEKLEKAKKFAVGIAVISAIGVTVCVMMATEKGMEMHRMCRRKALDAVENAKETIKDKADAINKAADKTAKSASNVINEIDKKADDLHENLNDGYHAVKKDIAETAGNISHNLKKDEK